MWMYLILTIIVAIILLDRFSPKFAKAIKGFKTALFGTLTAGIGFLEAFDWATVIREDLMPYWLLGVGVLVIYLRYRTTTAIGRR